ncbi:Vacuolar fusion protein mon1, partial [Spiromyces aspiralis]
MKLVTILRPKKHSLHITDLHLIFSMVSSSRTFDIPETCAPICFPRYDDRHFLNFYIYFIVPKVALILVYPSRGSFSDMSEYKDRIRLEMTGAIQRLAEVAQIPPLSPDQMGVPGLLQFYYKSKEHVQHIRTDFKPTVDKDSQERILRCYQFARATMLASPTEPSRIYHQVNDNEIILGW